MEDTLPLAISCPFCSIKLCCRVVVVKEKRQMDKIKNFALKLMGDEILHHCKKEHFNDFIINGPKTI